MGVHPLEPTRNRLDPLVEGLCVHSRTVPDWSLFSQPVGLLRKTLQRRKSESPSCLTVTAPAAPSCPSSCQVYPACASPAQAETLPRIAVNRREVPSRKLCTEGIKSPD